MSRFWINTVVHGVMLLFFWWIIADGDNSSWWFGVPAVLIALTVSSALIPPVTFVWFEAIKFSLFFLSHSFLGGVDVARRVFKPNMSIVPVLYEYPLRLAPGFPQVLMANSVGLLPGTLSAQLEDNKLTVHVLDGRLDFLSELKTVEQFISRMFGQPFDDSTEVV